MNTEENRIADRIYELKDWILKHDRQYDLSGINEQRVKHQIELKLLDEKHIEEPFVATSKTGAAQNE